MDASEGRQGRLSRYEVLACPHENNAHIRDQWSMKYKGELANPIVSLENGH